MVRIAVTPSAYRAIKASLPEGSVLKPERDRRGRYLLMLDENSEQPELAAQARQEKCALSRRR